MYNSERVLYTIVQGWGLQGIQGKETEISVSHSSSVTHYTLQPLSTCSQLESPQGTGTGQGCLCTRRRQIEINAKSKRATSNLKAGATLTQVKQRFSDEWPRLFPLNSGRLMRHRCSFSHRCIDQRQEPIMSSAQVTEGDRKRG